jgi:hydrogenase-1 operon protein HyaE
VPTLHPLLQRLVDELSCPLLGVEDFDAWAATPGHALVFFSEDPVQFRETLDLAVIVPELARAFPQRFRVGVLPQQAARRLAPRYGFRRWPALVLLCDGHYVGAIDGVRDWNEYTDTLARLLVAPATRPPTIGIAVQAAGETDGPACH